MFILSELLICLKTLSSLRMLIVQVLLMLMGRLLLLMMMFDLVLLFVMLLLWLVALNLGVLKEVDALFVALSVEELVYVAILRVESGEEGSRGLVLTRRVATAHIRLGRD